MYIRHAVTPEEKDLLDALGGGESMVPVLDRDGFRLLPSEDVGAPSDDDYIPLAITDATRTLTAEEFEAATEINNYGATGACTWTLPDAVVGTWMDFARLADYDINLVPMSGQRFKHGGADEELIILNDGVFLQVSEAGIWEVRGANANSWRLENGYSPIGDYLGWVNASDYGAGVGKTSAQNKAALQAAIDALGPYGGVVHVNMPAINCDPGLTYAGTGGLTLQGIGKRGYINFVHTADGQKAITIDRTTAVAGSEGVSSYNIIKDITLKTDDTTYDKVCISCVDGAETLLWNATIGPYYGHTDSVGLEQFGREALRRGSSEIFATIPIRYRQNPNTDRAANPGVPGWLSLDHVGDDQLYLNNGNYRPKTLPRTRVLIDDGCHVSMAKWSRCQFVGKGHGIYGRCVTANADVSTNMCVDGVRFEGNVVPTSTAIGATTSGAGILPVGTTSIPLASAGAGTLVAGNVIQFAGDPYHYEIATGDAEVSNGGTIVLASPGLRLQQAATPRAITVTSYDDIHLEFHASTPLTSLLVINTESDNGSNFIYGRNIKQVNVPSCKATQAGSTLRIFDIDGFETVKWDALETAGNPSGPGSQALQLGTLSHKLFALHGPGKPFASTACYLGRSGAFTYQENGISAINGLNVWSWKGTLADDTTLNAPCNNGKDWEHALVFIQLSLAYTPTSTAVGAQTDNAGYAAGVSTITLRAAGGGSIVAGDYIAFAGDDAHYQVTSGDAEVSGGGSVTFVPALKQAIPAAFTNISILSGINDAGCFKSAPVAQGSNGIKRMWGDANVVTTDSDGDTCVHNSGAAPGDAVLFKNRTGKTAYVSMHAFGNRSVEY